MAIKNKEINNPKTGQSIKFLQTSKDTNGMFLEMESTYRLMSTEPPAHYHPYQAEDFDVLEGELAVRLNGQLKTLRRGESLHIPPGTIHSMWNDTMRRTVVRWKVKPALNTEYLLETTSGLAQHNKTNAKGIPPLLQVAVLMYAFTNVFRLAKPSYLMQMIVFTLLTPLSYVLGYRATYPKYLD